MAFEEKDLHELPVDETAEAVTKTEESINDNDPDIDITEPIKKERKGLKLPQFKFKRDSRRLRVGAAATAFTVVVIAAFFLLNHIFESVQVRFRTAIYTNAIQIYRFSS